MKALKALILAVGCVAAAPAMASYETYELQGSFDDGGTFSGTFEYDPVAHTYSDSSNPLGKFNVATVGGTDDFSFTAFSPAMGPQSEDQDLSSTPTELSIFFAAEFYDTALVLDWTNALNGPSGNSVQGLTGYESFSIGIDCPDSCPADQRKIVSGFVQPVPLPAAGGLMLSVLAGLSLLRRRRRNVILDQSPFR